MELKPKFKAGDKVFWISVENDKYNKSFCEVSIDIVESIMIYKDHITYWLASCDGEVFEDSIVEYDKEKLFKYLEENLKVNEVGIYD